MSDFYWVVLAFIVASFLSFAVNKCSENYRACLKEVGGNIERCKQ